MELSEDGTLGIRWLTEALAHLHAVCKTSPDIWMEKDLKVFKCRESRRVKNTASEKHVLVQTQHARREGSLGITEERGFKHKPAKPAGA